MKAFASADMEGVAGERTVTIRTTDALEAYRAFTAAIAITRGLAAS